MTQELQEIIQNNSELTQKYEEQSKEIHHLKEIID